MPTDVNWPYMMRRQSTAAWTADTVALNDGEPGKDTTTGELALGDGSTLWPALLKFTPGLGAYTADETTLHLAASQFSVKAGGVGTTELANSGVTLAKLANIADLTLLGNNTGGAAAPVALTASQVRTLLGLVVGTNVQAYDAELTAIAALVSAANKVPRFTGSGSADLLDFDTDPLLALDSNTAIASQRAVKGYVDSLVNGVDWKEHVRAATTGNITLSGLQTIDGVTLIKDDRVLAKNQTASEENGIWICLSGAWTRALDADSGLDLELAIVKVREGTTNALKEYRCSAYNITLGTTPITWLEWSAGTTYAADETTLHLAASQFSVKAGGVGTTELANSGVTLAKLANIADLTLLGNNTGGAAAPLALTAAQVRTLLGLVIGTNVQAYDAELTALAGLTSAADKLPYFTGSGSAALTDIKMGPGAAYSGTPAWTGTAPTGTPDNTQYFQRVGPFVFWQINIMYPNAGAGITNLTLPFPAEFPTPVIPPGFNVASAKAWNVDIMRMLTAPGSGLANATGVMLARNSGNTAWEIASSAFASGAYRGAVLSGCYFTA